ncbi:hypothetical protein ElyMa_001102800, partial [Elysia marginata]
AEVSAMEVDAPLQSSQALTNSCQGDLRRQSPHQLKERFPATSNATTVPTAAAASKSKSKKPTTGRIASSCESTFSSPAKDEEYLEPEVPVQATAEKFVTELKTKIALMFPNRDIQREISYDLRKLVKQSSSSVTSKNVETAIPFTDSFPCATNLSSHGKPIVNSTLAAFRPPANSFRISNDLESSWMGWVSKKRPATYVCKNPTLSSSDDKSWCHSYRHQKLSSAPNSEPHYSWMDLSPSITDKLPTLVSSSSSNHKQQNATLTAPSGINSFRGNLRSHLSKPADNSEGGVLLRRSSTVPRQSSRLHHHHRLLPQETYRPSAVDSTASGYFFLRKEISGAGCGTCSSSHPVPHSSLLPNLQPPAQNEEYFHSHGGNTGSLPGFGSFRDTNHGISSGSGSCCNCENKNARSLSFHDNSDGSVTHKLVSRQLGPGIIQSRQNFQIALDSACRDSGVDISFKDSGDQMDKDDFSSMFEQSQPSLLSCGANLQQSQPSLLSCGANLQPPWQKYGDIRTHQVDMQRQARDFLDDLEENSESDCHTSKSFRRVFYGSASSAAAADAAPPHGKSGSRSSDFPLKVSSFM